MTKKILVFEDRLGFVDGSSNISMEIVKDDGIVIQPEEEIELSISKDDWSKLQKDQYIIFKELAS